MKSFVKKIILLFIFTFSKKINKPSGLLVLTYHRVCETEDSNDPLIVSQSCFDNQIRYLKNNYTIISSDDLKKAIESEKELPDDACLITFDDGWRDNYTKAFPVLKKHAVPALIFISTNFIGTNKIFWHEKIQHIFRSAPTTSDYKILDFMVGQWPDEITAQIQLLISQSRENRNHDINILISKLKIFNVEKIDKLINELEENIHQSIEGERLMLTWEEIIEMSENNIDFGSHTQNHVILTQISEEQVQKELVESKDIMERKLKKEILFLSYPNGNYNDYVIDVTKKTGYLAAFTCVLGVNAKLKDAYELKRKHVREIFSSGVLCNYSNVFFKIDLLGVRETLSKKIASFYS